MNRILWLGLVLLLMPATASAQNGPSGYVFGGVGASSLIGSSSSAYSFGAGGEYRIKRFGIGGEIGGVSLRRTISLETRRSTMALGSVSGNYHFRSGKRGSRVRDPFVTTGVSFLNGPNGYFHYGGGMNYWFDKRVGLRLEFRDHINGSNNHIWQVRVGLTFR